MNHSPKPRRLLDQVRDVIRLKHYSYRTEQTYIAWIRRYILFHGKRHPKEMGTTEVEAFLTHLAVQRHVSASTQNQALSALLFLYRHVLQITLDERIEAIRAKRSRYLPTVLTTEETRTLLSHTSGDCGLVLKLLYGSGLRLKEGLQLRVKDLDFGQHQILVQDGKGGKSRTTPMPKKMIEPLQQHLKRVHNRHQHDLKNGHGSVYLPYALERKYPNADRQWIWQFAFPSQGLSTDPRSGIIRRHHIHESTIQKRLKRAVREAEIQRK